jgi:lipopolysaccharide export system permease protein
LRIYKYLYKEVMTSFLAVAIILVFIFVSSRFVRYLADAASGRFSGEVVLSILFFRLPGFLELIFPLAFFLGVMLSYGRLYVDSEMVVLQACGISKRRMLVYTQGAAITVMLVVALLSMYITPVGSKKFEDIWNDPETYSGLGTLVGGSFKNLSGSVIYTSELNQDKTAFTDVFIARKDSDNNFAIIRAESGQVESKGPNERYLELNNGQMVRGVLGEKDFNLTFFGLLGQKLLSDKKGYDIEASVDSKPTLALISDQSVEAKAALHWRLGLPFLVPIAAIIALALSETSHRRGRYIKLLPGILIYVFYLSLLLALKAEVAKGNANEWLLWLVHLFFLALGLLLYYFPELKQRLKSKPTSSPQQVAL